MEVFVARQPILDTNNQIVGYELLYRKSVENAFDFRISGNKATSILLLNSYYTFGIDRLSDGKKVFVNFEADLIEAGIPKILNNDVVVVELSSALLKVKRIYPYIKELKELGYTLAIDHYSGDIEHKEILEYIDVIKVDFLKNNKDEILKIASEWQHVGKTLLAEKVETQEGYEWAKSIGFLMFQGYYFAKPKIFQGNSLLTSKVSYLRILKELSEPEPNYDLITNIVESDAIMTYRLLKLVNANFAINNKISSLKQALVTLGLGDLGKWISLAMIQDLSKNRPPILLKLALIRGKFLEQLLDECISSSNGSEGMLIGLLSVLDVLADQTMEDALKVLPLDKSIKKTLLMEDSLYLEYYKVILNIEKGNYGLAFSILGTLGMHVENLMDYYYKSIDWSVKMYKLLNEG